MTEVRYKDMVKHNRTLADLGEVDVGNGFSIKARVKEFTLYRRDGSEYINGPCLSLQLFHGPKFLKAISIPEQKIPVLISLLTPNPALAIIDKHIIEAETKAIKSYEHRKWMMFGYWKAIVLHLKKVRKELATGKGIRK